MTESGLHQQLEVLQRVLREFAARQDTTYSAFDVLNDLCQDVEMLGRNTVSVASRCDNHLATLGRQQSESAEELTQKVFHVCTSVNTIVTVLSLYY